MPSVGSCNLDSGGGKPDAVTKVLKLGWLCYLSISRLPVSDSAQAVGTGDVASSGHLARLGGKFFSWR